MRKYNIQIFTIILILLTSFWNLAYANSGPTYWRGYPSLELLSVEENNPIVVEKEDLIFDFSREEYLEHGSYSISGLVTAAYRMSNNTLEDKSVHMAFPIISSIREFNPEDVAIEMNGESIPFKVYIGDEVRKFKNMESMEEYNGLDFETIVQSINKGIYTPRHYDLNEIGTLYTYDVSVAPKDRVYFSIDYTYDTEKTKIIDKGFNRYEMDEGKTRISTLIQDDETLEIYVIGEDVDFNISGFLDSELLEETQDYTYEVKRENISIEDYLKRSIEDYKASDRYGGYLTDNQLCSLVYEELDDAIERNVVNISMDGFYYFDEMDRIILLGYEVDFPRESKRDISVSYISKGAMSMMETYEPLYTFEYLLNPAKRWSSFSNLNVEIRPPKSNPYIVDSSIALHRDMEGNYIGNFESLPDRDLYFVLYFKDKVTFGDRAKRKAKDYSFLIPVAASIVSSIILWITRKFRAEREY